MAEYSVRLYCKYDEGGHVDEELTEWRGLGRKHKEQDPRLYTTLGHHLTYLSIYTCVGAFLVTSCFFSLFIWNSTI